MVGHSGGSTVCYASITLQFIISMLLVWNALSEDEKDETFPQVTPNFIVELHSRSSSYPSCHKKMLWWVNGGIEEGF
ncbi:hypothetical protein Glove_330g28 [Diversispora epigaea]|uniref:Uncharacterized protein n=1 Tax=Diversispora epigaea TaxID=1348612 RepID=A0A397HK17_9GLOM|nr:hypothetical protein Glove_330g28 [Diversispora epigaea]